MAMCVSFSSCSKDDDEVADTSVLIGTWDISHIYTDGEWLDISGPLYSKFHASITFKEGGSYYGTGYFGTGSGTYTYDGKTVKTYVSGKNYMNYEVVSLTQNVCELIMSEASSTSTVRIRAKKI